MKSLTEQNLPYVKILRNYMNLHQKLVPVDVIILMGSNGYSYIQKAIDLYQQGTAHKIICSGYRSKYGSDTEAYIMSLILIEGGVPIEDIILEPKASNTAANIKYSYQICQENNRDKVIIIHHPWVERRTYYTAMKQTHNRWQPSVILISSIQITVEEYDAINTLKHNRVGQLVGNLQRIKLYGEKGWIVHQHIPLPIEKAYLALISQGYIRYCMKGYPVW